IRDRDGVDVVHFRIQRDRQASKNTGEHHDWQIHLALDLPALGPLHARIGVSGHSVSTRFWAERTATRKTIDRELPSLAAALHGCGLETANLSCHAGMPHEATATATDTGLLDLHACTATMKTSRAAPSRSLTPDVAHHASVPRARV